MKKVFVTSALALALLSSSTFAVRTAQNIYQVRQASDITVHLCQHLTDDEGNRPEIGNYRLVSEYQLNAGGVIAFDPNGRSQGLYRVNANELSSFVLVDDALPSGFVQIFTQIPADQGSAAVRFFFEGDNRAFPATTQVSLGVNNQANAENGICVLNADNAQFTMSFEGITLHFIRLANGQYTIEKIVYAAADREDITPPQPVVAAQAPAQAGAVDGNNNEQVDDPELEVALAMSRQAAAEEQAQLLAALAESEREANAAAAAEYGAADDEATMAAIMAALQPEGDEVQADDASESDDDGLYDGADDDASEDDELAAALAMSLQGSGDADASESDDDADDAAEAPEGNALLRDLHALRAARLAAIERRQQQQQEDK